MGTCGICFRQAPCGYSQCRDCIESFGVQERPTEFRRWASNSDADALAAELEKCRAELAECESDRKLYRERAPLVEDLEATFDAIRTQRDTCRAELADAYRAVSAIGKQLDYYRAQNSRAETSVMRARLAAVEALQGEWERNPGDCDAAVLACARELREALK